MEWTYYSFTISDFAILKMLATGVFFAHSDGREYGNEKLLTPCITVTVEYLTDSDLDFIVSLGKAKSVVKEVVSLKTGEMLTDRLFLISGKYIIILTPINSLEEHD